MRFPLRTGLAFLCCLPLLSACGLPVHGNNQDPNSPDYGHEPGAELGDFGSLTGGKNLISFGTDHNQNRNNNGSGSGTGIGVNAYLWRGALDTLSFMPLSSADPFSGVIITDWYSPPGVTDERFKATAYIMSRDLRTDGVRLSIFRQVLQNGQWVDAPVSPDTVGDIENKVLARAVQLRQQSQANS